MNISEIVQGIVTVVVVGTVSYLAITGQPIPEALNTVLSIVLGFYFGSRAQNLISNWKAKCES